MKIMKLINKEFIIFYITYWLKRNVYRREGK